MNKSRFISVLSFIASGATALALALSGQTFEALGVITAAMSSAHGIVGPGKGGVQMSPQMSAPERVVFK